MIKKPQNILILLTVLASLLNGASFKKEATIEPVLVQSGEEKYWCPISGLKLEDHYKTNYLSKLNNGTKRQYSSMTSLVIDNLEYGIDTKFIKVIDISSQKFIDATSAHYLIGSKVKGTLSKKSKLAFKNLDDAKKFKKRYRGKIVDFETAFKNANDSLKNDIEYIKKRKKKKQYPMGKKIFKIMCNQDIDPTEYIEINEFKSSIVNDKLCKPMNEKRLHALTLYLWEVKRFGDVEENNERVVVKEHEKCPVCGMFTYKYPRWAAQIFYKHNSKEHHFSFDGVKDLMKFYFEPLAWGNYTNSTQKNITKILVTDYYSQKAIDGFKAYYVIRSDIYGPMGHEFIPFESLMDAQTFKKDHFGTKILKFNEITIEQTYKLDESL